MLDAKMVGDLETGVYIVRIKTKIVYTSDQSPYVAVLQLSVGQKMGPPMCW